MTTSNSIYICGPVSGTEYYRDRFNKAEKNIRETFDGKIVNPVEMCIYTFETPEYVKWERLMYYCLDLLSNCTHIYLMSGWEKSHGARIEQLWSEKLGLVEIREKQPELDKIFRDVFSDFFPEVTK